MARESVAGVQTIEPGHFAIPRSLRQNGGRRDLWQERIAPNERLCGPWPFEGLEVARWVDGSVHHDLFDGPKLLHTRVDGSMHGHERSLKNVVCIDLFDTGPAHSPRAGFGLDAPLQGLSS